MMRMKELREFLHYVVLLPRATLPYEVPLQVYSKVLRTTLSLEEAKSLLKTVKSYNFPLLQAKHKLVVLSESLRLSNPI